MYKKILFPVLFTSLVAMLTAQSNFSIEGHRGCRGLYPENTIIGFIEAVKLGVNTLELDVVVSKDGKVVVSHDPEMNDAICSTPDGKPMLEGDGKKYKLYQMKYEEIKTFDCGIRGKGSFPEQKKIAAYKPLLSDMIDAVETYIKQNNLPAVAYNIEIKSTLAGDDVEHPKPAIFAKLVYDVVIEKNILNKTIIQSFDARPLQELKKIDPTITLSLLIFNANSLAKNIKQLGFKPHIYSPNYILVNKKLIDKCHQLGIKIIPWTVNDADKMTKLKALGVDGLITDYPNIAIKVLR